MMRRNFLRVSQFVFVLAIIIIAGVVLIPRSYPRPSLDGMKNAQFWKLSDGTRIAYTLILGEGQRKKNPIVFVQGGPGAPIYKRNIESLSFLSKEGYDVYLYEQIGCGSSDRLVSIKDYTVSRHLKDLEEILEKIATPNVILLGQSWGAILATLYVAKHPNQVEKLILTSPGPILPIKYALKKEQTPDSLDYRVPEFTNKQGREKVYNWRAKFVEFCAKKINYKLATDEEMDRFTAVLNAEMGRSTSCESPSAIEIEGRGGYYCMIKTAADFDKVSDKRALLQQYKNPVLLMRGACDPIPWGYVAEYLKLLEQTHFAFIPNAGHSIDKTAPKLYKETILNFLNK